MKKKKKQSCSCTPQYEACKPVETVKTTKKCEVCKPCETVVECTPISSCKPCITEKKPMESYVECPCGNYEITCVDKCVELAKKAEELFDKACKYEADATQTFNQAKECEKSAKLLSQKACNLLQNANKLENQSRNDEFKAKELMQRAQELCEKAKALNKEAECIEKDAKSNCEKAKSLYEKAETYNEKAKCLYNQALKYDEKALECYKTAGDKIKEYEKKSKKCEEMIDKCGYKLQNCENNCAYNQPVQSKMDMEMPSTPSCGCAKPCKNTCDTVVEKTCNCNDEIIYVDMDNCSCNNQCSTYVSPMYNMAPMQCMGNFTNKYPSLDNSNMSCYDNQYDEMWMNYYMYMQQMMQQMPYNK
ncbi:MAG: hypothetical protein SPI06_04280 [Terrisporobacter sp.]|uniref:hypothetical protein n=1 Tax=Terrisporobacter sp. TaxID=1965305 RepID=UPI002A812D88|nr:hypothetical protein [Terrisporobacter sp.]MCI6456222.1 hypothetical protein [Clostridium sp.]MDY4735049.1 hypothetical protein [Terrisporobacter sp.]MDY6152608.1 hypothetical protein [Terrisporobacter sp.]